MQAAVLIISGVCIILYFTFNLIKAFRKIKPPKDWPVVEGRILLVSGNETLVISKLNRLWEIAITYQYEANGEQITQVWLGPVPRLKDKMLSKEPLEVYHHPNDPYNTFLEGKVPVIVIAVHIVAIAFGLMMAVSPIMI